MAKKVKLTKQQKWEAENEAFVNTLNGLSVGDLNGKLSSLSKDFEEICESLEKAKEPGNKLYDAKVEYDYLRQPFTEGKKLLKAKSKYVYRMLKDRGQ